MLYHASSAVMLAWEAGLIHTRRGDARRLLLSQLVLDHRLGQADPFTLVSARDDAITTALLSDAPLSADQTHALMTG
jgi:acyl-CoA dehydrogenase